MNHALPENRPSRKTASATRRVRHATLLRRGSLPAVAVAVLCVLAGILLTGCNARKRNTAAARQYTAFITRYNIHYNGDRHYRETLDEMERTYEDDYTTLLYAHPAEARADEKAPQPQGDFTRSIEKAQKAIQLRSITKKPARKRGKSGDAEYKAWMKRDEYNPFLHNDWLMMGRSQYMNGDFLGAAATFFYTSRHFSWLPRTVTEARLWQARSYLALDWLFEAETILTRIKQDELVTGSLRALYNLDMGELCVKRHQWAEAAPYLQEASRHGSSAQKTRIAFLLGQVYERIGDRQAAYRAFGRAAGSSSASYRTRFNARIRQSEVFSGDNIEPEVKALRRMTRYDRNEEYLDQIYYAIGNLYLSRRDTLAAIDNYRLGAEKSTRNGIDKAILNVALGGLYYDRHRYELAQPCYAEAVPLLPATFPGLDTLRRRSDVLDELAVYSQNVNLQDSLLRLAAMDSTARMKVIDKIISDLKKKEKEEAEAARREEYLANQAAQGSAFNNNGSSSANPNSFTLNTDNSWYFYNAATRNAGRTEFQRRWGSRRLEDNWRRRNKSTFNSADFNAGGSPSDDTMPADTVTDTSSQQTPQDAERQKRADDPHFAEYYLKQIPFTAVQKATARDVIQEGLYNMGIILKDKLEDYRAARAEFDRLLTEYPDNVYRLDVYYNLYLMFIRQGRNDLAEHYRQLILADFPDSKYGIALRNPDYIANLRGMEAEQQRLYDNAYEAYMDNRNADVHAIYDDVAERYPLTKLMPKFMFLHALAYVTDRDADSFNAVLRQLLERYPDTDLTPTVSAWLSGMAKGRKLQAGTSGGNLRGMIWDVSLGVDSAAVANGGQGLEFALNDGDRQLLVLTFPTDAVSSNQLLYDVARHNFRSFVVKDFDLEQLNFGRLGMIVIRDFADMDELNHYRRVMAASPDFRLPAGVRPVVISVPNFDALLHGGGSLDDYFRFLDEQHYIDAQQNLLPYTEIETLPEADSRAASGIVPEGAAEQIAAEKAATEAEQQQDNLDEKKAAEKDTDKKASQSSKKTQKTQSPPKTQKGTKKTDSKKSDTKKTDTKKSAKKRQKYEVGSEGDDELLGQP